MLRAILSSHIRPIEAVEAEPTIRLAEPSLDIIGRATLYVAKVPPASEGGRNRAAFKLAAALTNDFQLTDDDAWEATR